MEDLREQLVNCGEQGRLDDVLIRADEIAQLRGVLFDLNPSVFRSGPALAMVPDDPSEFYHHVCAPMLARHPVLAKAEVRVSGTGIHAILWFHEPISLSDPGDVERWSAIVQVVQTALPGDPDQPGITALTRPLGSTNSKNGATVTQLTAGTPVSQNEVMRLYRELSHQPFRIVCRISLGSEQVTPCPVCGQEGTKLIAADRMGSCRNQCGQIDLGRIYDLFLSPREPAEDVGEDLGGIDTRSRGEALAIRMRQGQHQVDHAPRGGARRLPMLCGLTSKGTFTRPMEDVLADARSLLLESERVYRYGNSIVMEQWYDSRKSLVLLATGGVPKAAASARLSNVFICKASDSISDDGEEFPPSRKLIELLANSEMTYQTLPLIEGYMQRPVFDEQFVFRGDGWHPDAGILIHAPDVEPVLDYEVPGSGPALDRLPPHLRQLLSDFPFRSDADVVNTVGVLLTGMMPSVFRHGGKALVLIDGNRPGVGKTALGLTIGAVMDSVPPRLLHYTPNDEELGKRICAALRERNQSVLLIDNARTATGTCVSSSVIEANSMAPEVSLRILGQSTTFTRPNDVLWMLTMNCTRVSPDLASRGVPIRLEYEGPPGERDFGGRDPLAFALEHRVELLGELAGMITRWVDAGCPMSDHRHRCSHWAEVIGGVLTTCGLPEFLENLNEAAEEFDAAVDDLRALVEAAVRENSPAVHVVAAGDEDAPNGDLCEVTVPAHAGLTASELEPVCRSVGALSDQIAACLNQRARATVIGSFLMANVGRQVEISVGSRSGTAKLVVRHGRSRSKQYCFVVRWHCDPVGQAETEGPSFDGPVPVVDGNGQAPNRDGLVNLAALSAPGSSNRFTTPNAFAGNDLEPVGEPGEPGGPPRPPLDHGGEGYLLSPHEDAGVVPRGTNMYPDAKTWSPFKGCEFDCTYCRPSFQKQAKRQKGRCGDCYHYVPHYHEERLDKIPSAPIVFVCGNADISLCDPEFTRRIIDGIKEHNVRCPHKTYYFQSKRPEYFEPLLPLFPENVVLLTTLETNRDEDYEKVSKAPPPSVRYAQFQALAYPRKVVTIEPVMDFDVEEFSQGICDLTPEYVWLGFNSKPDSVKLPEPSPEKVAEFMQVLICAGVPVKGKELRGLKVPEGGR